MKGSGFSMTAESRNSTAFKKGLRGRPSGGGAGLEVGTPGLPNASSVITQPLRDSTLHL